MSSFSAMPSAPERRRPPGSISPQALPVSTWSFESVASLAMPPCKGPIVVLAAHPDDETIGAGRMIAQWAAHHDVVVHLATAGEGCFAGRIPPGVPDVAERRLAEWRQAIGYLGAGVGDFAGWPDGSLDTQDAGLVEWVRQRILASDAQTVVAPWRHDPHSDHAALGAVAALVAQEISAQPRKDGWDNWDVADASPRPLRLVEYPVWATAWCLPSQVRALGWRVETWESSPGADEARAQALGCYRSQLEEMIPGCHPVVTPGSLAHHSAQRVCSPEVVA